MNNQYNYKNALESSTSTSDEKTSNQSINDIILGSLKLRPPPTNDEILYMEAIYNTMFNPYAMESIVRKYNTEFVKAIKSAANIRNEVYQACFEYFLTKIKEIYGCVTFYTVRKSTMKPLSSCEVFEIFPVTVDSGVIAGFVCKTMIERNTDSDMISMYPNRKHLIGTLLSV